MNYTPKPSPTIGCPKAEEPAPPARLRKVACYHGLEITFDVSPDGDDYDIQKVEYATPAAANDVLWEVIQDLQKAFSISIAELIENAITTRNA